MVATKEWTDLDALSREIVKTESRAEAMLLVALWGERDGWRPRAQHDVGRYRVDVAVPEAKVAIETDGFEHHSKNADLERDHERQNALVAAGWTPLRYSARQSFLTSGQCAMNALREINKRLRGRPSVQRRPDAAQLSSQMSEEEALAAAVEGGNRLLQSLSTLPVGDAPVFIQRRRHGG